MSAADVGQPRRRRRPTLSDTRLTSAADIFFPVRRHSHQRRPPTECRRVSASVVRRHCRSSFPTLTPTSAADGRVSTLRPTSAADVGVSVGKLDRQCRRPTLADTQADTQSVTLGQAVAPFGDATWLATDPLQYHGYKEHAHCALHASILVIYNTGTIKRYHSKDRF